MDLETILMEVQSWSAEQRLHLIELIWDGQTEVRHDGETSSELKAIPRKPRRRSREESKFGRLLGSGGEAGAGTIRGMRFPPVRSIEAQADFDAAADWS